MFIVMTKGRDKWKVDSDHETRSLADARAKALNREGKAGLVFIEAPEVGPAPNTNGIVPDMLAQAERMTLANPPAPAKPPEPARQPEPARKK